MEAPVSAADASSYDLRPLNSRDHNFTKELTILDNFHNATKKIRPLSAILLQRNYMDESSTVPDIVVIQQHGCVRKGN